MNSWRISRADRNLTELPVQSYGTHEEAMLHATPLNKRRLVVVSNRLPFTIQRAEEDFQFIPSVGGLATGLSSYLELLRDHPAACLDYLWVGWPGGHIEEERKDAVLLRSLSEFNALPVFLSGQEIEKFYQGFCNKTIWPLFHYFQVYTNYDEDHWKHYVDVNQHFCRALLDCIRPDDILWIHDYHLMLLPAMIRRHLPSTTIGFFLHIPFPSFEIFRLLPSVWRREILEGLLGADLIGFHTNDYKQDFLRCVLRILGHDANLGEIIVGGRIIKAETFPMGIDFKKYSEGANDPGIQRERDELGEWLVQAKVILSIDRLDYTKGILNRLKAFQIFLESYPSWRGKAVLLLIVSPSRVDVDQYETMKNGIEALVGLINGRFGHPGWTPIIYMFRTLTFAPLVAMYSASHVALLTPLRDGMNLIAKEYVASRSDQTGVLILSEMTGASKELLEAIIINPNNCNEIADAIFEALNMPLEEQIRRNTVMQLRLRQYDVVRWATDFVEDLKNAKSKLQKYHAKVLSPSTRDQIKEQYSQSGRRLLLLDYDGTLVPFTTLPYRAVPGESLLKILGALSEDPRNEVVIISGRGKDFLSQWFSTFRISLVAEHGAWMKTLDHDWQTQQPEMDAWKPTLRPLLERYVDRVIGSFVEEKDFALVWHYRGAEAEPGKLAAQELKDHLLAITANVDVHVLQGNKTVEVRIAGVNKGTGGLRFLSKNLYDFVLCIGDDATDEDLFAVLPDSAHSIRVGLAHTRAKHTIPDVKDVIQFLEEMVLPRDSAIQPATQTVL